MVFIHGWFLGNDRYYQNDAINLWVKVGWNIIMDSCYDIEQENKKKKMNTAFNVQFGLYDSCLGHAAEAFLPALRDFAFSH